MSDYGSIDLSGTLVTASGVAACRPRALVVYGRSTQDGTPTPSAPVAIQSVAPDSQGNISLLARGLNLFAGSNASASDKGVTRAYDAATNTFTVSGTATTNNVDINVYCVYPILVPEGGALTFSLAGTVNVPVSTGYLVFAHSVGGGWDEYHTINNNSVTFTNMGGKLVDVFKIRQNPSAGAVSISAKIQVQHGSTATAYQPYTATVTPVPLDGHELRSLPDGTRDELTVDADGHAVLVQRVGVLTLDGSETWTAENGGVRVAAPLSPTGIGPASNAQVANLLCDHFVASSPNGTWVGASAGMDINTNGQGIHVSDGTRAMTANGFKTWLASNPVTVDYPLATPQTIDLGTVDMANLTSPDLTAQTVPSAEFELTALLKTGRSTVMWDGEELGAGWTFVSDRREQLLPTDVATIDVPGRDGALFGGVTRAVRQVTLALYVLGPVSERAPHVRELAARLAVDGPRPLMFSDEAPLWRMAVPNAESDSEVYYDAEGYTDVEFVCPDPWLYGEERSVTVPSGGSVTFTVGGTAPTWPTITASATGSSQGTWILRLDDSSKGVYAAIASGVTRPVVADCDARTLTVNDATSMLAPSYDWPELTPGTHTLAMTAGTGAATVTWTERWW